MRAVTHVDMRIHTQIKKDISMRNWNVVDHNGKVHILRAWSARHAKHIAETSSRPFTPAHITLIGRANPDNEDGWRKPGVPKDKAAKK